MKSVIGILITFLMIIGCDDKDPINDEFEQYTGNYKTISFKSNIAVDLNNDKVTSKELINEINSFDFNDLEIRPHENQLNSTKLISFFFPKTWISFQYPGSPEGWVEFLDYGFSTTYQFKDNSFSLKENSFVEESYIDNVESNKEVKINSDLAVIDDKHLKISISKEYYDFNTNNWIMLDLEILYEKY